MFRKQENPATKSSPSGLAEKASFQSSRSAGSATSASSSRSGGSKLLFGEIDISSERSSSIAAYANGLVLCESLALSKFWLEDKCRKRMLSYLPTTDLKSLRCVGHSFAEQVAETLFSRIRINFDSSVFTKASRTSTLERIGHHATRVTFSFPHTDYTDLPPLINPETGEEVHWTYKPSIERSLNKSACSDPWTMDLLRHQYPPLFHAATNVNAFVRAFSNFTQLQRLRVRCPGYDSKHRYRRSIVDYALISLRIAVEQADFRSLNDLTLAPIHLGGVMSLSPFGGLCASPRSAKTWARMEHLSIETSPVSAAVMSNEPDPAHLLSSYLRMFQTKLQTLYFCWTGHSGPLPFKVPGARSGLVMGSHPALHQADADGRPSSSNKGPKPLHFPKLVRADLGNIGSASIEEVNAFHARHKSTEPQIFYDGIEFCNGSYKDIHGYASFAQSTQHAAPGFGDIQIGLSPSLFLETPPLNARQEPLNLSHERSHRAQEELTHSSYPRRLERHSTTKRVRFGWSECEEQLKKMLKGGFFSRGAHAN